MVGGFTIPSAKKEEEPKISFSDKDIENLLESGKTINSSICCLVVGQYKTGKTGICLDCRTPEEVKEGKKIIYIECNSDHGGRLNKKEFHDDNPNIIVLDPKVVSVDLETGDYIVDYKKTLAQMKALIKYLKDNKEKLKIKAVVLDGADKFLSEVCEMQMRLDEHTDITGGISFKYWRKRNMYFYDVVDRILGLDVDVYIITHPKKDSETGEITYGVQKDLPEKMHQILETRKDGSKFYVKLVADRRKITDDRLNKDILFAEQTDKGIVWYGYRL